MVLSHGQHQHLIKPKDKHGPRSTAELISSPGCISQLLSICPNTNLLFFRGEKREHQNNADRSMLLGLFKNMIIQQSVNINYHWLVLSVLWIVITPGFLTWCILLLPEGERSSQKKKQKYEKKRRVEFGKHHHYTGLSFSVLDFVAVRARKIFMLDWSSAQYMSSRCSMSSQTVENGFSRGYTTFTKEKHGLKRKTWVGEA